MGGGIAITLANAGYAVRVVDAAEAGLGELEWRESSRHVPDDGQRPGASLARNQRPGRLRKPQNFAHASP